jgi:hypothetical protein
VCSASKGEQAANFKHHHPCSFSPLPRCSDNCDIQFCLVTLYEICVLRDIRLFLENYYTDKIMVFCSVTPCSLVDGYQKMFRPHMAIF